VNHELFSSKVYHQPPVTSGAEGVEGSGALGEEFPTPSTTSRSRTADGARVLVAWLAP